MGPVPSTRKALEKAGLDISDIKAAEINEAFASQSLASVRELGLDPEIVNRDGGAIALGHPLGSSGARIVITLLGRMDRELGETEGRKLGLATLCIGVGQGQAIIVEAV